MTAHIDSLSPIVAEPAAPLYVERVSLLDHAVQDDDHTTTLSRYTLSDGSRYDVQRFVPDRQRFDVAATYTTPWCTDLRGFNERVGMALAHEGMHAIAVSPERLSLGQLRRFGRLSLLHDAEAQHVVLNHIDLTAEDITPATVVSLGYSRGAMVGFGLNATSMQHRRDIRYSDYTDPCLEHQVQPWDVDWEQIPAYLGHEAIAMTQGLLQYSPAELVDMTRKALNPSVCFWLQQIALTKTLFSGEAGELVAGWHDDSVAFIQLFTHSRFNHASDWERQFKPFRNVTLTTRTGVHMSGVHPKVLAQSIDRVVSAQQLIRDNASAAEISLATRGFR
jgi:hypothetical protein